MTAPYQLGLTYGDYKRDTNLVISWLGATAKLAGYVPPKSQSKAGSSTGAGKSKKEPVKVKEMVAMARVIQEAKPQPPVPPSVIHAIHRAIVLRQKFAQQRKEYGLPGDKNTDTRHQFFIDALKGVLKRLEPLMKEPAEQRKTGKDDELTLSQKYERLAVEQPSDEFLKAWHSEVPDAPEVQHEYVIEETSMSKAEALEVYMAMLEDLYEIREFVRDIWQKRVEGLLHTVPAAIATNSALDMARNVLAAYLPELSSFSMYDLTCWHFSMMTKSQEQRTVPKKPLGEANMVALIKSHYGTEPVAKSFLLPIRVAQLVDLRKEEWGGVSYNYRFDRPRESLTPLEKYQLDTMISNTLGLHAKAISENKGRLSGFLPQDEFLRGAFEVIEVSTYNARNPNAEQKGLPWYFMFANQVYMDIANTIGGAGLEMVFGDWRCRVKVMLKDVEDQLSENSRLDPFPASMVDVRRALGTMQSWLKLTLEDPLRPYLTRWTGLQSHKLMYLSPILCGLSLFRFYFGLCHNGLAIANTLLSTTCAAQLYNALRQEGLVKEQWEDMDDLKKILGENFMYAAERPLARGDYRKAYERAMGVTVSSKAPSGSRQQQQQQGTGLHIYRHFIGHKQTEIGLPVLEPFKRRYADEPNLVGWSLEDIQSVIAESKTSEQFTTLGDENWIALFEDTKSEEPEEDPGKGNVKGKGKRKALQKAEEKAQEKKRRNLTRPNLCTNIKGQGPTSQWLRSLAIRASHEHDELTYPLLVLHRKAWEFLGRIMTDSSAQIRAVGPGLCVPLSNPDMPKGVMMAIFRNYEGARPDAKNTLLHQAARAFQAFIAEGGGRAVRTRNAEMATAGATPGGMSREIGSAVGMEGEALAIWRLNLGEEQALKVAVGDTDPDVMDTME